MALGNGSVRSQRSLGRADGGCSAPAAIAQPRARSGIAWGLALACARAHLGLRALSAGWAVSAELTVSAQRASSLQVI